MTDTPTEKQADLLVTDPPAAPLATVPVHPLMATIDAAVREGKTQDLKDVLDLYERMEKKMEEKAYDRDFLAFQQECEPLPRTGKADEVTARGTRVEFTFCKLSDLDKALPVFWKHGFTREFGTLRLDAGKAILECTFRHRDGHSVTKEAEMLTDSNFLKNAQNRVIGATSYLKRMLFGQMLGVPVCDLENKLPQEPVEPVETITGKQANELNDLLLAAFPEDNEANNAKRKAWRDKLLTATGLHPETHTLADFPAAKFDEYAGHIQRFVDELRKDGT